MTKIEGGCSLVNEVSEIEKLAHIFEVTMVCEYVRFSETLVFNRPSLGGWTIDLFVRTVAHVITRRIWTTFL